MKNKVWELMYRRWSSFPGKRVSGYSVLLMLPGDLPVFYRIALDVLAQQERGHMTEVLVIPDILTSRFYKIWQETPYTLRDIPFRLIKMNTKDQLIIRFFKNPGHIHWLQHVRGVESVRTTHALVHDADLFVLDAQFFKKHYEKCADGKFACVGVSQVWDDWYASQGIHHLVATWEMMFDVEWFLSYEPWKHRGHEDVLSNHTHVFDTTLLPQCLTQPERITKHERFTEFVHFNYVISAYRWFQRTRKPFQDEYFRLFLIRLLMIAYEMDEAVCKVPPLRILEKGLSDPDRPVYYGEVLRSNYIEFQNKLNILLEARFLKERQKELVKNSLVPFDEFYDL